MQAWCQTTSVDSAFELLDEDEEDMLAYFESSLGWKQVLTRTLQRIWRDDTQALAAQLSYYFFLALFPALLCLVAFAIRRQSSAADSKHHPDGVAAGARRLFCHVP